MYYPYSYIIVQGEDDVPYGLYGLQGYLGFSIYKNIRDITISDQTDTGFSADFTAEYFNDTVNLSMGVVAEKGPDDAPVWKIDYLVEK